MLYYLYPIEVLCKCIHNVKRHFNEKPWNNVDICKFTFNWIHKYCNDLPSTACIITANQLDGNALVLTMVYRWLYTFSPIFCIEFVSKLSRQSVSPSIDHKFASSLSVNCHDSHFKALAYSSWLYAIMSRYRALIIHTHISWIWYHVIFVCFLAQQIGWNDILMMHGFSLVLASFMTCMMRLQTMTHHRYCIKITLTFNVYQNSIDVENINNKSLAFGFETVVMSNVLYEGHHSFSCVMLMLTPTVWEDSWSNICVLLPSEPITWTWIFTFVLDDKQTWTFRRCVTHKIYIWRKYTPKLVQILDELTFQSMLIWDQDINMKHIWKSHRDILLQQCIETE